MAVLFNNFNLGGGYNTGVNPYLNKPSEAREALGVDFSNVGTLSRFSGYSTYATGLDASDVLGLYDFKTTAGVTKWLAVTGTVLYYDNSGTWTSALTGLTTGQKANFATHLDTVIMVNGTDVAKKSTNGTSWSSLGGTPPVAKYVITFDNKVYMLNLSGFPSRMRYSNDGTIETWTSTNIQDVITDIGVGDEITGAAVNNNSLLVFKNYSTWKWDTFSLITLNTNTGCRAPRSIATIDDKTFFLSHKGVMMSNGGKPVRISLQIRDFIDGISDITAPVGWAEDNIYYLYIGTSNGVTNCLLIYDYDHNAWSYKSLGDSVKAAAILTTSGNVRSAYFGNSAGQVYKFKTGNTDNTAAIPFKWVSSLEISKAPHLLKDYQYLYVMLDRTAKPGIDVFYSIDFQDFKSLGTAWYQTTELKFPPGTTGHNIRLAFESNTTLGQQGILGYVGLGEYQPGRLGNVK